MIFVNVLRELLNDNLKSLKDDTPTTISELTFVLLIGLGLLSRLLLRLRDSLLYLPFLRGLRLGERGDTVRRGLEGDLESGREASE